MKTILSLVLKDLRRDWKRPWSILIFAALPLVMTALMGSIFGGGGGEKKMPTIHIEVLDQDKDMFAKMLRSMSGQGATAKSLQLHFVDRLEDGLRNLENRKASALVVLPKQMTEKLLAGQTNTIELYENPAEQVLPKVVWQGVSLLAAGLSGASEVLHEPLAKIREMFLATNFPSDLAVLAVAGESLQKLRQVKSILFPPLIQFGTVDADDYVITNLPPPVPSSDPNPNPSEPPPKPSASTSTYNPTCASGSASRCLVGGRELLVGPWDRVRWHRRSRSADFLSAVSHVSNLHPSTQALTMLVENAEARPTGSRRYSRQEVCATQSVGYSTVPSVCRQEVGDTADWKSALHKSAAHFTVASV